MISSYEKKSKKNWNQWVRPKKAKSKKNHTQPSVSNKRKNDGYVSVKYDEKKSYANVVLIVIVGILLLYLFLK